MNTPLLYEGNGVPNGVPASADSNPSGPRILLLTPYTGSNFGDGAIQDAVIHNLRKRLPKSQISLVTLCPERTRRLHGLPSYPIGSVEIRENPDQETAPATPKGGPAPHAWIRRIPWLRRGVAIIRWPARKTIALFRTVGRETRHVLRVRKLLVETDLLVMSGGGQIDDYWGGAFGHPYALFKWALIARLSGTPVAFPSVGVCSLERSTGRFFAYNALRLASYRSYRDRGSKELLKGVSFTRTDAECPDLAFSHSRGGKAGHVPARPLKAPWVIGLSPIIYLSQHGWPEIDLKTYDRYLEVLREFVERILAEGHSVLLFVSAVQDQFAVADLRAKLHPSERRESWGDRLQLISPESADQLLDGISRMDLVVASRLHGVILSHLLHKPVLAVSYDRKVRAHMASVGQEAHCLDLRDCKAGDLWASLLELAAGHHDVSDAVRSKTEEFRRSLDQQYDLLGRLLVRPS